MFINTISTHIVKPAYSGLFLDQNILLLLAVLFLLLTIRIKECLGVIIKDFFSFSIKFHFAFDEFFTTL
jgi:hypothetical protein